MRRGIQGGLAVLSMYDRPEVAAETDALWAGLREAIRDAGLDAPDTLTRNRPNRMLWAAPELVLGQTCGLPYVSALRGRVGLIGTPDYAVEGCRPGWYRSAIVVRADDPVAELAGLRGCRPAINSRDSQSGYAALMHQTATLAHDGGFFGPAVMTGAHAASVIAVAEGRAEVAAIDAVTWRLCLRVEPKAQALRVLCWSDPAPGLPYITGRRAQAGRLAAAVTHGIAALDPALRETIGLAGFVATRPEDYDLIRDRLAAAQRLHSLPTAIA